MASNKDYLSENPDDWDIVGDWSDFLLGAFPPAPMDSLPELQLGLPPGLRVFRGENPFHFRVQATEGFLAAVPSSFDIRLFTDCSLIIKVSFMQLFQI